MGVAHNTINRYHLSDRRTNVYCARTPDAVGEFQDGRRATREDIGPDLRGLLRDPEFLEALRAKPFYKMDPDERFQVTRRAVTFGYAQAEGNGDRQFRLIRFRWMWRGR